MALTQKQYAQVKEELDSCQKPLFFFHDDPDGLCSFLQFYKYKGEGYGVIVKSRPLIDKKFLNKVHDYNPDKIFVLDIAMMEQEFVDEARVPIVWLDHHPPQDIQRVKYFNPRNSDPTDHPCIAYLTYKIVEQSLWLAVVGSISDMHWPEDLLDDFRKQYPGLLPEKINDARSAFYQSKTGELAKILNNVLKGSSSDAMKYVKALTRVNEPGEILEPNDARGRFLLKKHKSVNEEFKMLLADARKAVTKDRFAVFTYHDNKMAFSSDLANEMIYHHPDKIILIGREKSGEIKMSLRSNDTVLPPIIEKAMVGLQGYGGGHEFAAGACVKAENFSEFVENLKKLL